MEVMSNWPIKFPLLSTFSIQKQLSGFDTGWSRAPLHPLQLFSPYIQCRISSINCGHCSTSPSIYQIFSFVHAASPQAVGGGRGGEGYYIVMYRG